MQTSEPIRPDEPVTRRVFMCALLVRDLADGNEIEREKHRVLMGKGQATNKNVREGLDIYALWMYFCKRHFDILTRV